MTEEEYEAEMKWLDEMSLNTTRSMALIAERIKNGVILSYPLSYSDSELDELYEKFLKKDDDILKKKESLYKEFHSQS